MIMKNKIVLVKINLLMEIKDGNANADLHLYLMRKPRNVIALLQPCIFQIQMNVLNLAQINLLMIVKNKIAHVKIHSYQVMKNGSAIANNHLSLMML